MALAVWADAVDVAIKVCTNARLGGAAAHPANPDGHLNGQGGWDVGIHFANLGDLATQLNRLAATQTPSHMCPSPTSLWSLSGCPSFCPPGGLVTRLAINAHGKSGKLYAGGRPDPTVTTDPVKEAQAISVKNLPNIAADLKRIYVATAPDSVIFLMGCVAGAYDEGTELLKALAGVWPQRTIVAYRSVGFQGAGDMYRSGWRCSEPGMRDTQYPYNTAPGARAPSFGTLWNDLNKMPWASETSPGAKVIRNGQITEHVMDPPFPF